MLKPRNEDTMMSTPAATIKQTVHQLVDQLPETATWDDVLYEMAVRRDIERGLADSEANRIIPVEEVMQEFGITE